MCWYFVLHVIFLAWRMIHQIHNTSAMHGETENQNLDEKMVN